MADTNATPSSKAFEFKESYEVGLGARGSEMRYLRPSRLSSVIRTLIGVGFGLSVYYWFVFLVWLLREILGLTSVFALTITIGVPIAYIAFRIFLRINQWFLTKTAAEKMRQIQPEGSVRFVMNDDGLSILRDHVSTHVKWTGIVSLSEGPHYLMFAVGFLIYLVPKPALGDVGEQKEFIRFALEHMTDAARQRSELLR